MDEESPLLRKDILKNQRAKVTTFDSLDAIQRVADGSSGTQGRVIYALWCLLLLASAIMFLYGSDELSRGSYFEQEAVANFNNEILVYSQSWEGSDGFNLTIGADHPGGYSPLSLSNFYIHTGEGELEPMFLETFSEHKYDSSNYVDNSYVWKFSNYTSAKQSFLGTVFRPFESPRVLLNGSQLISINSPPYFSIQATGLISDVQPNSTGVSITSDLYPIWFYNVTSVDQGVCNGLYLSNGSCLVFSRIDRFCLQVALSYSGEELTPYWTVMNTNNVTDSYMGNWSGCYYPVQETNVPLEQSVMSANGQIYKLWEFNSSWIIQSQNSPILNETLDDVLVQFLSYDDPSIALSSITYGSGTFLDMLVPIGNDFNPTLLLHTTVMSVRSYRKLGITKFGIGGALLLVSMIILAYIHFIKRKSSLVDERIGILYRITPFYILAIVCSIFSICANGFLLGQWTTQATFARSAFSGLVLSVIFVPLTILTLWNFVSFALFFSNNPRQTSIGSLQRILLILSIFLLLIPIILYLIYVWVRPQELVWSVDPLRLFLGLGQLGFYVPFSVLIAYISVFLIIKPFFSSGTIGMIHRITFLLRKLPFLPIFTIIMLFPLIFLATIFLPPIWNVPMSYYFTVPQFPYSWIETNGSTIIHQTQIIPKLYTDVIGYYVFLYLIILSGLILHICAPLRSLLQYRVGKYFAFGEILVFIYFLGFSLWFGWYWFFHYGRIRSYVFWERFARTLGHLSNLFTCYLLFPVSRNSIWDQLFGVPFDRLIKFHRVLGYTTLGLWISHALAWTVFWYHNNYGGLENIITIYSFLHEDNFTLPLMFWFVLVPALISGFFTLNYFRRNFFELFYYTHHLYLVIFMGILIHAWSLWYFILPSISLYLLDRFIRLSKGTSEISVVSFEPHKSGYVRIELSPKNSFLWNSWKSGQYVFMNIPSLSYLQWHPFSISSPPSQENMVFYIKNMGEGTWTGNMHKLAKDLHNYGLDTPIIRIDGPYGNCLDPTQFKSIILVAGGVGITPIHSILRECYLNLYNGHPKYKKLEKITLLWTVRDLSALEMFSASLVEISQSTVAEKFNIMIHVSQMKDSNVEMKNRGGDNWGFHIAFGGRMDMAEKFKDEMSRYKDRSFNFMNVASFVCAPAALVENISGLAAEHGIAFHEEIFEF